MVDGLVVCEAHTGHGLAFNGRRHDHHTAFTCVAGNGHCFLCCGIRKIAQLCFRLAGNTIFCAPIISIAVCRHNGHEPIAAVKRAVVNAFQAFRQTDDGNRAARKSLCADGLNAIWQHNGVQRLIAVKCAGLHLLQGGRKRYDAIGKGAGGGEAQKRGKKNSDIFAHGISPSSRGLTAG